MPAPAGYPPKDGATAYQLWIIYLRKRAPGQSPSFIRRSEEAAFDIDNFDVSSLINREEHLDHNGLVTAFAAKRSGAIALDNRWMDKSTFAAKSRNVDAHPVTWREAVN